MKVRIAIALLAMVVPGWAQVPATCPSNKPVDDLIAMTQKLHSKRANRNKGLLPESVCLEGWCMKPGATPTTFPQDISNGTPTGGASEQPLTEAQIRTCQNNFDDALRAAHNVEVGDFAMEQKNYRAARDRYSDALTEKPGDAAIYVRLGRAEEQISDFPNAKAHYAEAVKLGAPKKWADEANAAVERIDKQHAKDLRESPH